MPRALEARYPEVTVIEVIEIDEAVTRSRAYAHGPALGHAGHLV